MTYIYNGIWEEVVNPKSKKGTDRPTDQPTNQPTDRQSYSMIFLECNIRNLYISAPEHHSKMRIAPLDRAQKTIFSMFFLIS